MSHCPGKSLWPELLGADGDSAVEKIGEENPMVTAKIFKEGAFVTGDFRCDRVRVFVDKDHMVVKVPHIG